VLVLLFLILERFKTFYGRGGAILPGRVGVPDRRFRRPAETNFPRCMASNVSAIVKAVSAELFPRAGHDVARPLSSCSIRLR